MKVFGIAGYSGSGKTTLIEQLIPEMTRRGLRVSVLKHAHHGFDIDKPGKDSHRHREAGATEVMITSGQRWALLHEFRDEAEPPLIGYLQHFSGCDLVLVEGFKQEALPKLEVHRPSHGKPPIYPDNPWIRAVASDVPLRASIPVFDLADVNGMVDFVLAHAVPRAALAEET